MISFVETKLFTRLVQEYLSDDEYRALQQALLQDPRLALRSLVPAECGSCAGASRVAASVADCG